MKILFVFVLFIQVLMATCKPVAKVPNSLSPTLKDMLLKRREKRDDVASLVRSGLTSVSDGNIGQNQPGYDFAGESSTSEIFSSRRFRHTKRGAYMRRMDERGTAMPRNFFQGASRPQFKKWECVRDSRGRCRLTKCAFMAPIDRISRNVRFGCKAVQAGNSRHLRI